jgi:hypothetical protein
MNTVTAIPNNEDPQNCYDKATYVDYIGTLWREFEPEVQANKFEEFLGIVFHEGYALSREEIARIVQYWG